MLATLVAKTQGKHYLRKTHNYPFKCRNVHPRLVGLDSSAAEFYDQILSRHRPSGRWDAGSAVQWLYSYKICRSQCFKFIPPVKSSQSAWGFGFPILSASTNQQERPDTRELSPNFSYIDFVPHAWRASRRKDSCIYDSNTLKYNL